MKKKIIFALGVVLSLTATGQNVQEATLKDGSVLTGYIKSNDGRGKIQFKSNKSILVFGGDSARVDGIRDVKYADLSPEWKEWAEENGSFEVKDGDRKLKLGSVTVTGRNGQTTYNNVKVLGRGTRVKFLSFMPQEHSLSWDQIHEIKGLRRPDNVLSGLMRHYDLTGGRYEGEYAGESSSEIYLYKEDGEVVSFPRKNIVKTWITGINPNQKYLLSQSELMDVVNKKKGGQISGLIIEQNYGSKPEDNYLMIQTSPSDFQSVKLVDIENITKAENPEKDIRKDVILQPGEITVNGKQMSRCELKTFKSGYALDSIPSNAVIEMDKKASCEIELLFNASNETNVGDYKLIKLEKVKKDAVYGSSKGKKNKKAEEDVYVISYKALVDEAQSSKCPLETSVNNTTKACFDVFTPGEYILFDNKSKFGVPFIVK